MNVLSLFDGMSCGQIALERAGIKVDKYFASEIKPHAIKCTLDNYPNTIHVGDVREITPTSLPKIDMLIGGSPCQDLSLAKACHGKDARCGLDGDKSGLFWEYIRLYKELKPKYFLLENVVMPIKDQMIITEILGVEPIRINSRDFSYQLRDRLYWTNIPVNEWTPKRINFQDWRERNPAVERPYKLNRTKSRLAMWGDGNGGKCPNVTERDFVNCLTVKQDRWNNSGLVEFEDFCRYLTREEMEMAQTVPVGYTKSVSWRQSENLLGDGWTVDVIAHIFNGLNPAGTQLSTYFDMHI